MFFVTSPRRSASRRHQNAKTRSPTTVAKKGPATPGSVGDAAPARLPMRMISAAFALGALVASPGLAQDGSLDPTFGVGGFVHTDFVGPDVGAWEPTGEEKT